MRSPWRCRHKIVQSRDRLFFTKQIFYVIKVVNIFFDSILFDLIYYFIYNIFIINCLSNCVLLTIII